MRFKFNEINYNFKSKNWCYTNKKHIEFDGDW